MVAFLISEMKFPEGTIVSFAECMELFPSPTIEKVKSDISGWYKSI